MKSVILSILILGLFTLGCCGAIPQTDNSTTDTGTPSENNGAGNVSDLCVSMPAWQVDSYNYKESDIDCYNDRYIIAAYWGQKNYTDCDEMLYDAYRGACYGAHGAYLNDSSRCSEFSDSMIRDLCKYMFAILVEDPGACDQITSETFRQKCMDELG
jgi:hypothetical protein